MSLINTRRRKPLSDKTDCNTTGKTFNNNTATSKNNSDGRNIEFGAKKSKTSGDNTLNNTDVPSSSSNNVVPKNGVNFVRVNRSGTCPPPPNVEDTMEKRKMNSSQISGSKKNRKGKKPPISNDTTNSLKLKGENAFLGDPSTKGEKECFVNHNEPKKNPSVVGGPPRKGIRPVERERMRDWLSRHLNADSIRGLYWLEKKKLIFRIPWKHGSSQNWTEDDAELFVEWAKHTGRYYPDTDKGKETPPPCNETPRPCQEALPPGQETPPSGQETPPKSIPDESSNLNPCQSNFVFAGRSYPDTDKGKGKLNTKRFKATFRCALNSLPDCQELSKLNNKAGSNAFKVYQFSCDKETCPYKRKNKGKGGPHGCCEKSVDCHDEDEDEEEETSNRADTPDSCAEDQTTTSKGCDQEKTTPDTPCDNHNKNTPPSGQETPPPCNETPPPCQEALPPGQETPPSGQETPPKSIPDESCSAPPDAPVDCTPCLKSSNLNPCRSNSFLDELTISENDVANTLLELQRGTVSRLIKENQLCQSQPQMMQTPPHYTQMMPVTQLPMSHILHTRVSVPQQSQMSIPQQSWSVPQQSWSVPQQSRMSVPQQSRMSVPQQSRISVPQQTRMSVPQQSRMPVPPHSQAQHIYPQPILRSQISKPALQQPQMQSVQVLQSQLTTHSQMRPMTQSITYEQTSTMTVGHQVPTTVSYVPAMVLPYTPNQSHSEPQMAKVCMIPAYVPSTATQMMNIHSSSFDGTTHQLVPVAAPRISTTPFTAHAPMTETPVVSIKQEVMDTDYTPSEINNNNCSNNNNNNNNNIAVKLENVETGDVTPNYKAPGPQPRKRNVASKNVAGNSIQAEPQAPSRKRTKKPTPPTPPHQNTVSRVSITSSSRNYLKKRKK